MSDLLSRDDVMKTALEWFLEVFGATDLTGLEERLMELDVVDKTEVINKRMTAIRDEAYRAGFNDGMVEGYNRTWRKDE